jgi:hypothetical protein
VCLYVDSDADRDGLADACESALLEAFAPLLIVAPSQCLGSDDLPPGGYLYGARPLDAGVRLVYLPAYFMDCGLDGVKCLLPLVDCDPHPGDSEFIALDVARRADGGWGVDSIFLSAHCFGRSEGGCRWYRDAELDEFAWTGARGRSVPIVWVSEGRNANYPSRSRCDRGHNFVDTCDRNTVGRRFPTNTGRNIGSRSMPIGDAAAPPGCVRGRTVGDGGAAADALECFWSEEPFRGWQARGPGLTPYLRYLEMAGF